MTHPPCDFHSALQASELAPGEVRHVVVAGQEVAVFNLDGAFFATSDRCTHMRARLSDGYFEGGVIECPLHFGKFDVRTGRALSPPCKIDLPVYPVRVEDGAVRVGNAALPSAAREATG